MEEINDKIEALENMLIIDGYNEHNYIMITLKELRKLINDKLN